MTADVDPLEAKRHTLADLEQSLPAAEGDEALTRSLREQIAQLEAEIAAEQNPVGAAVAGEVVDADVEIYRPDASELVVSPGGDDLWTVLDKHDEDAILEEFQRRALKVMLYEFPQSGAPGGKVIDLSYQGVNEAVRLLNNTGKCRIRIRPDVKEIRREVIEGVEYVVASVYAEDERTGYGQFGTSREPIWMKVNANVAKRAREKGEPVRTEDVEGTKVSRVFDVFAETKALNKAQRNALKVMIPERMRQALIAMARHDDTALKTIQSGAGASAIAELPPPLDDEKAKELNVRIRAAYDRIRVVSVTALLPGAFGAKVARAQHSHDLLLALAEELEAQATHLEAKGG